MIHVQFAGFLAKRLSALPFVLSECAGLFYQDIDYRVAQAWCARIKVQAASQQLGSFLQISLSRAALTLLKQPPGLLCALQSLLCQRPESRELSVIGELLQRGARVRNSLGVSPAFH